MLTDKELIEIGKEEFGFTNTRRELRNPFPKNYDLIMRILEDYTQIPYLHKGEMPSEEGKVFIRRMKPADKSSEITLFNFKLGLENLNKKREYDGNYLEYDFTNNGFDTSYHVKGNNFLRIWLNNGNRSAGLTFNIAGFYGGGKEGKYSANASFFDGSSEFMKFVNNHLGPNRE